MVQLLRQQLLQEQVRIQPLSLLQLLPLAQIRVLQQPTIQTNQLVHQLLDRQYIKHLLSSLQLALSIQQLRLIQHQSLLQVRIQQARLILQLHLIQQQSLRRR